MSVTASWLILLDKVDSMDAERVIRRVLAEPFQPFRVRTTDGRAVDVCDDGAAYLGATRLPLSTMWLDIPDAKGPWYHIPFTLIESIDTIQDPPTGRN